MRIRIAILELYFYSYVNEFYCFRPVDTYIDSPPPTMVQTSNVVPPADVVKDKYRLVNPAAVNSAIVQVYIYTLKTFVQLIC